MAGRLQKEIRDDVIRLRRTLDEERPRLRRQILKKLKKLEEMCGEDDRFIQQFILGMKATVGTPEGPYRPEESLELLTEAIRLTVPNFRPEKVSSFRYSSEEVMLVNRIAMTYANMGERKKAIGLLSRLLRYIEKNNRELDKFAAQFGLVAHNCAIDLVMEGEYAKAAELAQRGWDVCVEKGDYQFLPGFVAILAECSYYLGDSARSKSLYVQAYNLYKTLGDDVNLTIMMREMKDYFGMEPPYTVW